MFEAFKKIDAGGPDAKDKRVDMDEWLRGYKNVSMYGFVAFEGIREFSKKKAQKIFEEIDDNGGGVILLNEWCSYLKAKEIKAGTELGKILDEEQPSPNERGPVKPKAPKSKPANLKKPSSSKQPTTKRLSITNFGSSKKKGVQSKAMNSNPTQPQSSFTEEEKQKLGPEFEI